MAKDKPLDHYTNYFKDFFVLPESTTPQYVLSDIKPAYSLFIDSLGLEVEWLDTYLNSSGFSNHYEMALKSVNQYVKDVLNNSALVFASRMPLQCIVATHRDSKYVIKGEFVLRVINDFIQGKIKLADIDYHEFLHFVASNSPWYKDSLIELYETTIMLEKKTALSEYLYLLDRYETYDENFISGMKNAVDIFVF